MEKLRSELRALRRVDLLIIAERAADLVPRGKLKTLLHDFVLVDTLPSAKSPQPTLFEEVQAFYTKSLAGQYYESFDVNSKNFTELSMGTESFLAEFHRLLTKCVRAAKEGPPQPVRDAFELLFRILERIDESQDDVIFLAKEAGSWQVGVAWRMVFPIYFRCLAETASAAEFGRIVNQVVRTFARQDWAHFRLEASKVANAAQAAALNKLKSTS
jgi:hypothetical protein